MRVRKKRLFRVVGEFKSGWGDHTYTSTRHLQSKGAAEATALAFSRPFSRTYSEDYSVSRPAAERVTIQRSEPVVWLEEPVEFVPPVPEQVDHVDVDEDVPVDEVVF